MDHRERVMPKFTVSLEIPISAMCEIEIEADDKYRAGIQAARMARDDQLDFSNFSEVDLNEAKVVAVSPTPERDHGTP